MVLRAGPDRGGWLAQAIEQFLTHSKCSAIIMIQVFAIMMKTLAEVLGPDTGI